MPVNVIEEKGKNNFRLLRIIIKRGYNCLISHICLVFLLLVMTVSL